VQVEAQQELVVQQRRTAEADAAIAALERRREQSPAVYLAEAQQLLGAAHRAGQTVLTAPIGGTVQQLAVHTVGGVVTPAQARLTVVPNDGPVLVDATVENGDIGFVHAGQDVEVKVRAFEFTRHGLLHGDVMDVSRDRVLDATPARPSADAKGSDAKTEDCKPNEPGYVAHVALDSTRLVIDGRVETLSPGMAVTAEIKTGRRSVISYLLSPLQRYAHEGIRER
jgi:hemolysin D